MCSSLVFAMSKPLGTGFMLVCDVLSVVPLISMHEAHEDWAIHSSTVGVRSNGRSDLIALAWMDGKVIVESFVLFCAAACVVVLY